MFFDIFEFEDFLFLKYKYGLKAKIILFIKTIFIYTIYLINLKIFPLLSRNGNNFCFVNFSNYYDFHGNINELNLSMKH